MEHESSEGCGCFQQFLVWRVFHTTYFLVKAHLVSRGVDFPYTHNIVRLRKLCLETGDWAASLSDADELSPFAITARYPGEELVVSEADAAMAIRVAERVREVVRKALSDEGEGARPADDS